MMKLITILIEDDRPIDFIPDGVLVFAQAIEPKALNNLSWAETMGRLIASAFRRALDRDGRLPPEESG